eukprot:scaffold9834_cov131-Skeletonema_dohrnii-CCMP3373.AAC.7
MAQSHFQLSSPNNKRPLSLSRHHQASTNIDAGAEGVTELMDNSIGANNAPTSNRVIRRAASVDDDSGYVGREKYQHHQLLPNRLLFGPPSPSICSNKDSYGRDIAVANYGANTHRIPLDGDEKCTESSTQVNRQVVPQDRSFLLDNEDDATANITKDAAARSLIFRKSPTTKTTVEQPLLHQPSDATPVNFLASSSPPGSFSIPGIRPSLSCPTSVFDSPLLPIGASTNQPHHQPIMPCQSNDTATDRLNAVDVSAIEYYEDDDATPSEDGSGEETNRAAVVNPMRNLSDAFELLVSSEDDTTKKQQRPKQSVQDTFTASSSTCDVTFEDNMKSAKTTSTSITSTKPSPTSVLGFDTVDSSSPPATKKGEALQLDNGITVLRMSLPRFQLHEDLCGEMHQGLIDRVSFYSIVRDINKEAADAAMSDPKGHLYNDEALHQGGGASNNVNAKDGKVHAHPIRSKESENILVLACTNGEESMKPSMGAALLDEEWWLLSAMASRSPEEVALNHASALPSTFSEALGEKDSTTGDSNTSSSKTQLWKPGRSWWEAKSGKNPWVEPVVHNNRWRYLWPLIHYHKFLAKSIRKLRRNGIDVKTSTSSVSLFLRQEVCNVSDHLAFMSKYDSEQWTSALRCFDGWTDHTHDVEESVRKLVLQHKLQDISEMSDLESSLLRSQVSDAMLRAIKSEKEKLSQDAYSQKEAPATKRHPNNDAKNGNWKRPPVHSKTPNKMTAVNRGARWKNAGYNAPYAHHGMHGHGQHFHPPHPYAHPSYGHYHYHHHQYSGYDHYPPHHNLGYAPPQYPVDQYGQQQYYQNYPIDGGYADTSFDGSAHLSEESAPSAYPDETPTRYAGNDAGQYPPPSPYWNHLNLSQLPGLCSPGCQLSPASSFHARHSETELVGKAKSLIMFPKQTNSPASRFNMSPQDYTLPYYNPKNTAPVCASTLNDSVQDESFVLPPIEGFSAETPQKKSGPDA